VIGYDYVLKSSGIAQGEKSGHGIKSINKNCCGK
jgi:hypothetical protein